MKFQLRRRATDTPGNQRRMRKSMYLLPSLFTTANIAAGYYAISQCMLGASTADFHHFDYAAIAIGFAVLFDGLDGRIARMTGTMTDFGKELDSLADVITFGVAPAILGWMWGFRYLGPVETSTGTELGVRLMQIGGIASFLFLVAVASRLARFNIQSDPKPSNPGRPGRKYFVGMPSPAGAGMIAATVHFANGDPVRAWWLSVIFLLFTLSTAFLMVSTWRFYSFKDIDLRQRHPFQAVMLVSALIASIWYFSEYVLFFIALTYMLSGVLARLMFNVRRAPQGQYSQPQESR